MSAVVYATHDGDALRVYVRAESGEIRQVSQSTVTTEIDPIRFVSLVADLDVELGWSRNGAALDGDDVVGARLAVEPPAAVLPPAKRPVKRPAKSSRRMGNAASTAGRARTLEIIDELGRPVGVADLASHFPGVANTGTLHGWLAALVSAGELVREGEPGLYRWRRPTTDTARRPSKRASPAELAGRRQRVLDALAHGPLRTREIAALLGLDHRAGDSTVRDLMRRLADDGQVKRDVAEYLNSGSPVFEWALP